MLFLKIIQVYFKDGVGVVNTIGDYCTHICFNKHVSLCLALAGVFVHGLVGAQRVTRLEDLVALWTNESWVADVAGLDMVFHTCSERKKLEINSIWQKLKIRQIFYFYYLIMILSLLR